MRAPGGQTHGTTLHHRFSINLSLILLIKFIFLNPVRNALMIYISNDCCYTH